MKQLVISAILIFLPMIVSAEKSEGIESSNYKTSFSINDSDNGSILSLRGKARFPVANYTGISLNAGLSEFDGDNNFIDTSIKSIGLGAFIRKYDLGIIEAAYSYSEVKADIPSGSLESDADTYSLSGTYYLEKFDLSLNRGTINNDSGNDFNFSNFSAAYYVNDNLLVSALVGAMDTDESYSLSATYQPKVFNNAISISASYQSTNTNDSYGITISYYFDTKVNLINRIRRY